MPKLPQSDCRVIAQAVCASPILSTVEAVAGQAKRVGRTHIAIRFGSLLFYLEDRDALDSLARAVRNADALADRAFGPVQDAFTEAAERELRAFERGELARESLRRQA